MTNHNYKDHFKKTFLLAYPVMLSQVGHIFTGIADSVMVGRIGAVPLAAASLAHGIFAVIMVFGIGVTFGVTPLVASEAGQKKDLSDSTLLSNSLVVNMLTGIILFLILFLGSPALRMLNQPTEVVNLAIPYFNILLFSLIPLLFFQTYKQFAEGLSFTRMAMIVSLSGNLLNIILNYILIYGKLGFPAMGLNGAGWATLIARTAMGIAMSVYVLNSVSFNNHDTKFHFNKVSATLLKKITKIGIPIGMQFTIEVGAFAFAAVMIGWMGAQPLAAHQIALSMAAFTYMLASGISAATTVRVSNAFGRKDFIGLKYAANTSFMMVLIFMGCCALFFIIANHWLPTLFIKEIEVIEIAAFLLIIAAFFQLSDGMQVVVLGALRGLHDVNWPTIITVIAYWIIALPVGYFLGFILNYKATGVWIGLLTGLLAAATLLYWRFRYISGRKLQTIS